MSPIHPGEILREEFLAVSGTSQAEFADRVGVSRAYMSDLCRGRRGLSAEMAIRLARVLNTTPEFWWNMQCKYELEAAKQKLAKESAK